MSNRKPVQSPEELVAYLLSIANEPADQEPTPEAAKPETAIVIKPGSHHASAAYKTGREDDYIDRMAAKYGGEW